MSGTFFKTVGLPFLVLVIQEVTLGRYINLFPFRTIIEQRSIDTELYKSSFSFSGPKVWNALPNEIKTSKTVFEFKNSYKLLIF
jgi:hypothetical protein